MVLSSLLLLAMLLPAAHSLSTVKFWSTQSIPLPRAFFSSGVCLIEVTVS